MRLPGSRLGSVREPVVWLGVNYWSRAGGPRMWRNYDPAVVSAELEQLRGLGLNLTRSFFFWPDFMPTPDSLDEQLVGHFRDFLDKHRAVGMQTVPTFIVGHMSGQNWDPPWRGERDIFADVWFVARQAWFVKELTKRFADHPAVAGWLLSNEMPIYGDWRSRGVGTLRAEQVESWAQLLIDANRAGGGTQPISIGDGAWGIEVTGLDNGFRARDLSRLIDFSGPHVYRMETDQVRQWLGAAFICELSHWDDKPVVLEEFGVTDDYVGPANAGHYYRQVLHNTLLAGVSGWICWNNADYDNLFEAEPYRHHPHEMHFGIVDSQGNPKPTALEMQAFGELARRLDFARLSRPEAQVALVVSSYLEAQHPFTCAEDATAVFQNCLQAYVAGREADLGLAVVREHDGVPEGAKLYLLPSVKQLTAPGWRRLAELAERGAWVYASCFVGVHATQRGLWWPDFDDYFGVRHLTRYGLTEAVDDLVTFTFVTDFGSISAGEQLRFRAGGNENSRCLIPVAVTTGEVIAHDQDGRPAVVRNARGDGYLVLCTYPLEHFAATNRDVNPEDTWRLYDALAVAAGVDRVAHVADGRVSVASLDRADGSRLIWMVNLSADSVDLPVTSTGPLTTLAGDPVEAARLQPFMIQVVRQT